MSSSSSKSTTSDQVLLYVWPKLWDLPSFDPYCLSAILFLQLALPGQFQIVECTDVDLSPTGQLPFLVHGTEVLTTFGSIVRYVAALKDIGSRDSCSHRDADGFLSPLERSQRNAWLAHVEANLGNVVASAFYTPDNWSSIRSSIASLLPIPQRYFVPQKLRNAYYPKLQAAGLWSTEVEQKQSPFDEARAEKAAKLQGSIKPKISKAFEKENIVVKAKSILDVYERMLQGKGYVFGERISSIDTAIAARILLLRNKADLKDDTITKLISTSYPALAAHSERVYKTLLGSNTSPPLSYRPYTTSIWSSVLPFWKPSLPSAPKRKDEETELETQSRKMRWAFVGLALGSFAAYMWYHGEIIARGVAVVQAKMEELEAEQAAAAAAAAAYQDDDEEEEEE